MPTLKRLPTLKRGLPEDLQLDPNYWQDGNFATGIVQARTRAHELLMRHLDKAQREQLRLRGIFRVRGSLGGGYLMTAEGNVLGYCVHAYGYNGGYAYYVPEDSALAILLTLRTNEAAFLDVAAQLYPARHLDPF